MNILFIGNSYTFYHDMPKLLEALALENGMEVRVDSVTKGGRRLYENLAAEDEKHLRIEVLVSENSYDVLFLQEQSFFALVDYEKFEYGVSRLIDAVKAKRNILYATWGRKSGSDVLKKHGWTSQEMTFGLDAAYRKAANACGAEVSPVGMCFYRIAERYPALELYDADLSHPSYLGSCVAALAHYRAIFGELPEKTSVLGLEEQTLRIVKDTVDQTVR